MKKAIPVLIGILIAALGVYALCVPLRTFLTLGWVMGALLMINGLSLVFASGKNVWRILLGVLLFLGGGGLLVSGLQRLLTDVLLACFAGGAVILCGVNLIVTGVQIKKTGAGSGVPSILFGVLSILAGLFALGHPFLTMVSAGYLIAGNLILQGINMAVFGFVAEPAAAPAKKEA